MWKNHSCDQPLNTSTKERQELYSEWEQKQCHRMWQMGILVGNCMQRWWVPMEPTSESKKYFVHKLYS